MWEWQILTIQQTACPASVKPFTAMLMFTSNRFYPSVTTHACWRQFKPINTMPHTGRSLAYPLFHRCWSPPLLARTGLRAGSNQHETVRKEISWLFFHSIFPWNSQPSSVYHVLSVPQSPASGLKIASPCVCFETWWKLINQWVLYYHQLRATKTPHSMRF